MSTYQEYWNALGKSISERTKELILERAAHDPRLDLKQVMMLVARAYPDEV